MKGVKEQGAPRGGKTMGEERNISMKAVLIEENRGQKNWHEKSIDVNERFMT